MSKKWEKQTIHLTSNLRNGNSYSSLALKGLSRGGSGHHVSEMKEYVASHFPVKLFILILFKNTEMTKFYPEKYPFWYFKIAEVSGF